MKYNYTDQNKYRSNWQSNFSLWNFKAVLSLLMDILTQIGAVMACTCLPGWWPSGQTSRWYLWPCESRSSLMVWILKWFFRDMILTTRIVSIVFFFCFFLRCGQRQIWWIHYNLLCMGWAMCDIETAYTYLYEFCWILSIFKPSVVTKVRNIR